MRFRLSWALITVVVACVVALPPQRLSAQEARGSILGKVTDASGGVIPGASVEITNKAMGTKVSLVTNEAGFYQATFLIPGLYQIAVDVPGFRRWSATVWNCR